MAADNKDKKTILTLNRYKKEGKKAVFVSAYTYWQSKICNSAGIDAILVGDSLSMCESGNDNTLPATMDQMIYHAEAVKRGNSSCYLIGDLPWMSYQISNEDAIRNAGRFIAAGMDAVKVEGCFVERVKNIVNSGAVVMGHVGLTPQTRAKLGGYRIQCRTKKDADVVLDQAKSLQDAGCASLLFEGMPNESSEYIASQLDIPCYGIGGGNNPSLAGQLVIFHDLVGLFLDFKSKFTKRYCEGSKILENALREYAEEVRSGKFPGEEHFYHIKDGELELLLSQKNWKNQEIEGRNMDLGTSAGC